MGTTQFPDRSGSKRAATSLPVRAVVTGNPVTFLGFPTVSTTSASLQTVITIPAGAGRISFVAIHNGSGVTLTNTRLKITIDGIVAYDETGSLANLKAKVAIGAAFSDTPGTTTSLDDEPFYKSLLIEHNSDGTNQGNCDYGVTPA